MEWNKWKKITLWRYQKPNRSALLMLTQGALAGCSFCQVINHNPCIPRLTMFHELWGLGEHIDEIIYLSKGGALSCPSVLNSLINVADHISLHHKWGQPVTDLGVITAKAWLIKQQGNSRRNRKNPLLVPAWWLSLLFRFATLSILAGVAYFLQLHFSHWIWEFRFFRKRLILKLLYSKTDFITKFQWFLRTIRCVLFSIKYFINLCYYQFLDKIISEYLGRICNLHRHI